MKKTAPLMIALPLLFSGCASTGSELHPTARVGKIIDKNTFINQVHRANPVNVGVSTGGWGGGNHFGWGLNMGLNQLFGLGDITTTETVYQYKIEVSKNDNLIIQSNLNLAPNQCVNVFELPGSPNFPQITPAANCINPGIK